MIEFLKTHRGRKFFEGDIPNIIDALNRIATALEGGNKVRGALNSRATYHIPKDKNDANNIEEYVEDVEDDVQRPSTETG